MNLSEYEYKGLIAQAWDVLRGDTSNWPDQSFYLEIILKYGQTMLDVGCGIGRLLLDYRQQGIDIDGVDNSPDMLALCRHMASNFGFRRERLGTIYESVGTSPEVSDHLNPAEDSTRSTPRHLRVTSTGIIGHRSDSLSR